MRKAKRKDKETKAANLEARAQTIRAKNA